MSFARGIFATMVWLVFGLGTLMCRVMARLALGFVGLTPALALGFVRLTPALALGMALPHARKL